MVNDEPRSDRKDGIGWYVSFALIAVVAFLVVGAVTGQDVLAAAVRILWNAFALLINAGLRIFGSLLGVIARGVGWRRLTRIANVIGGIGLGYAASVVLSEERVRKAYGWRGKFKATLDAIKGWWHRLHLAWKLAFVAALVASQVYLHTMLIIFPVSFLVPIVRRLWVGSADMLFGSFYWSRFGARHRKLVAWMRTLPGIRGMIGWVRLTRIRYLTAWRLWKYHPRYFDPKSNRRMVNLFEPMRLWWLSELDGYIGQPLLAGPRTDTTALAAEPEHINPDHPDQDREQVRRAG